MPGSACSASLIAAANKSCPCRRNLSDVTWRASVGCLCVMSCAHHSLCAVGPSVLDHTHYGCLCPCSMRSTAKICTLLKSVPMTCISGSSGRDDASYESREAPPVTQALPQFPAASGATCLPSLANQQEATGLAGYIGQGILPSVINHLIGIYHHTSLHRPRCQRAWQPTPASTRQSLFQPFRTCVPTVVCAEHNSPIRCRWIVQSKRATVPCACACCCAFCQVGNPSNGRKCT